MLEIHSAVVPVKNAINRSHHAPLAFVNIGIQNVINHFLQYGEKRFAGRAEAKAKETQLDNIGRKGNRGIYKKPGKLLSKR